VLVCKSLTEIEGYSKEQVFQALTDLETRKKWDKGLGEFKMVEYDQETNSEVLYSVLKV
jgi:hypothetical protein